ncbi:Prolyl oligopeptidase family protein [Pedobacter rhizosphaerae]|uniref:Prolyl oligopeptidase family protein n=1 Tax=Pedobacter rhizosphaerae TaxID=390241 RepID=A0A1H9PQX1_9SPHI|nr:Prolyl oligopeptidase family protein [Pedobacter rhizosphaerae]
MGGSAGAHLALMVGLQSPAPVFTGDCGKKKINIAGIISKYGPTDLLHWDAVSKPGGTFAAWAGIRPQDTTFLKSLSPINYVSEKNIPVLLIHGDQDRTVPVEQSITLYNKLKQNGNETTIHIVKNGGHGNFGPIETAVMDEKMMSFITLYTK